MFHPNVHSEAVPSLKSFPTGFANLLQVITMEFHVLVQVFLFCKCFVSIHALKFFVFPTVGSVMMIVLNLAVIRTIASWIRTSEFLVWLMHIFMAVQLVLLVKFPAAHRTHKM